METNAATVILHIRGMTCVNCESRIEHALLTKEGIIKVKASYSSGRARITYDPGAISEDKIRSIVEGLGYGVADGSALETSGGPGAFRILGVAVVLLALYMLMDIFGLTDIFSAFPQAEENMGYGMLFVIGLLTSLHCTAMCGGINISQCAPVREGAQGGGLSGLLPSALYNLGRVVSYTLFGAIVGAVGSAVSFSGAAQGIVQLAAGVFMVIMGVNMLGIFPRLRVINIRMPKAFAGIANKYRGGSPFVVGLLNGLMPCGPLQAMQLYALSTGSPLKGALSMLLFSLGTVPLMFGLGALSTLLNKKFYKKMGAVSAVLVVVLGISMLGNGWTLSGFKLPGFDGVTQPTSSGEDAPPVQDGVQTVTTRLYPSRYEPITVSKGIPVKWTIQAQDGDITGCNNVIVIPEYGKRVKLAPGDNVIEFTPDKSGTFTYSCWMGMIRSRITVLEGSAAGGSQAGGATKIPTGELAVAEIRDGRQYVEIEVTKDGFSPAVVVLQRDLETEWIIRCPEIPEGLDTILFPSYDAQLALSQGDNPVFLVPDTDFEFASPDYSVRGYVKVVDNISGIDPDKIKEEINGDNTAA